MDSPQDFQLSYATLNERNTNTLNKATISSNMPNLYEKNTNNYSMNMCHLNETSYISYRNKQSAIPNS